MYEVMMYKIHSNTFTILLYINIYFDYLIIIEINKNTISLIIKIHDILKQARIYGIKSV